MCPTRLAAKRFFWLRWRSWFWQWQKPYLRLEAALYRLPKTMRNALALPVMRCLVLAVEGLAGKCLSSRSWGSFCITKGYGVKIFCFQREIQEALPNVKSGVEFDESGDLCVLVVVKSGEWPVFLAHSSGSRASSGVQPQKLGKECGLSDGEWMVLEDVVSILRYPRTSKRTRRIWWNWERCGLCDLS